MKMNVDFSMFVSAFESAGRGNQFSYEGKQALFRYLSYMEDNLGEEINLDIIELCCEYSEYSGVELLRDFEHLLDGDEGENEEKIETIIERLADETEVIPIEEGGWIIRKY